MDPMECYAPCIEYVTYIYHRFKLNANRYSIGGASLQKSRSSYVEQNHSPHQTARSKIWNAFPSFLIQVQTLHPGKTHMELQNHHQKQNDQNGDFRMRCIRLWIFRISSSPPGWLVPIGIEDPEVAVTSAIDVPCRERRVGPDTTNTYLPETNIQ